MPVLRKVQQLSLKGIAAGLDELIEKARQGEADRRRHQGRHLHHLQPRRLGLALRRADHHQPAAIGDPRRRQAGEAGGGARGRRRRHDPDPADGLCQPDHRPPGRRRPPDQCLAEPRSSRCWRAGRRENEAAPIAGAVSEPSLFAFSRQAARLRRASWFTCSAVPAWGRAIWPSISDRRGPSSRRGVPIAKAFAPLASPLAPTASAALIARSSSPQPPSMPLARPASALSPKRSRSRCSKSTIVWSPSAVKRTSTGGLEAGIVGHIRR